jgi:uncharacterized protein (TIGR02597 family)
MFRAFFRGNIGKIIVRAGLPAIGFAVLALAGGQAEAQTGPVSPPFGFLHVTCLANSDTYVSVPFTRLPEFTGTIDSSSSNVLTISGSTGWTANQFVYAQGTQPKSYYVILSSGTVANPKAGSTYSINSNSSTTLTLNLNGDDISSIPAGSVVTIIPYWTLNTLFPASNAGTEFTASAGSSPRTRATQILFPDFTSAGINLAPPVGYYFYNGAWRQVGGDPTVDMGDTTIGTEGYIIVRNVQTTTTLTAMGSVLVNPLTTPLSTQANGQQDNAGALLRPVGVTLDNLGLITSNAFAASPGSSADTRGDELLVYDNSSAAINKAPTGAYYYYNGAWRLDGGDPTVDQGGTVIPAGTGFTIRKAQTSNGASAMWENTPTYSGN